MTSCNDRYSRATYCMESGWSKVRMKAEESAAAWPMGVLAAEVARDDPWGSFNAMYEQSYRSVWRYTHARVPDPHVADDLVADVFERALRGWHTFERRSSESTWVIGIARNVVADHYRRRSRAEETGASADEVPDPGLAPDLRVEKDEDAAALRRIIAGLPGIDQDLLALRYGAEMSFRDIGRALDIGEVAARVRLHRLHARLRAALKVLEAVDR